MCHMITDTTGTYSSWNQPIMLTKNTIQTAFMCIWTRIVVTYVILCFELSAGSADSRQWSLFCSMCAWPRDLPDDSICGHTCMNLCLTWQKTWNNWRCLWSSVGHVVGDQLQPLRSFDGRSISHWHTKWFQRPIIFWYHEILVLLLKKIRLLFEWPCKLSLHLRLTNLLSVYICNITCTAL